MGPGTRSHFFVLSEPDHRFGRNTSSAPNSNGMAIHHPFADILAATAQSEMRQQKTFASSPYLPSDAYCRGKLEGK
jgi:hypothetical protein